jgi:hypothetical protein
MLESNGSDRWTMGDSGGDGCLGDREGIDVKLSSNNSGASSNFAGSSREDRGGRGLSVVSALKYLRSPPAEGRFTGFVCQQ